VIAAVALAACRERGSAAPPASSTAPVPPPASSARAPVTMVDGGTAPTADACPVGWTCDPSALERRPAPDITEVLIHKRAHRLYLVTGTTIVRSYAVALGYGGAGPKRFEGDAVTPIGTYAITGRLENTRWHTFLSVSYPNVEDQRRFADLKAHGAVPAGRGIGFGIAIHGHRADQLDGVHKLIDWTLGCVALDNGEIDEVASLVRDGTRVVISED